MVQVTWHVGGLNTSKLQYHCNFHMPLEIRPHHSLSPFDGLANVYFSPFLYSTITSGAYGMRLALRGMDSTKWQGIVQYWRVDTISTNSGGYGRSWWSFLHREEYPGLLGVARDHLGILGRQYRVHLSACFSNPGPATTIEVGRPFSQGGILLSHIHNRFTSQAIDAVMCMVSWSHTGFVDLVNQPLNQLYGMNTLKSERMTRSVLCKRLREISASRASIPSASIDTGT